MRNPFVSLHETFVEIREKILHEEHEGFTKLHEEKSSLMEFDLLSKKIIGCAIEVHRLLGPGLLESAYEECLSYELMRNGMNIDRQRGIPIIYKEIRLEYGYRLDLLVERKVIVELKSIDFIMPVHHAQLLTYMRFAQIRTGLLINFNVTVLKNGLKRFVL